MAKVEALLRRVLLLDGDLKHLPVIWDERGQETTALLATSAPLKGIHDVLQPVVHIVDKQGVWTQIEDNLELKAVGR